jgi:hypothetical protein
MKKHTLFMLLGTIALTPTMRGIPQIYQGTELLIQNKERQGDVHERLDIAGGKAAIVVFKK